MNSQRTIDEFDQYVDATRQINDEELAAASERFRHRLPAAVPAASARTAPSRSFRWAAFAGVVLMVSAVTPFLMPGSNGNAFAAVKEWFVNFSTLNVQTSIRNGEGTEIVNVNVWTTADGSTRVDLAPAAVHILKSGSNEMVTLLPGDRYMRVPLPVSPAHTEDSLQWLEDIRTFKGQAEPIGSKQLNGQTVSGHQLEIDQATYVIWSDPATGEPLQMEGQLPGGLELLIDMRFNEALPTGVFEIPAGYLPMGG